MNDQELVRDTIVNINLGNLYENIHLIKDEMGPEVGVMAVVKADGYGHCALGIADTLIEAGADYLAVATLSEAIELKEANKDYPLFILGHTPDRLLHYICDYDIVQTVFSLEQVKKLSEIAWAKNKTAKVHIKIDTGFHRLGMAPSEETVNAICEMFKLPAVKIEGIFSHFALAGEAEDKMQYDCLVDVIEKVESRGCKFKYKHIADSIACLDSPQYRLNMVRVGSLIYGLVNAHKGFLPVKKVMSFETRISQLHQIKKGDGVGYDFLWRAEEDSLVATLPFGYADGYPRAMKDKGFVVINGVKAPIIGVLCMDQVMADVSKVPDVKCGDKAIIYGTKEEGAMTVEEVAKIIGANKNDVMSRLAMRAPHRYIK